MPNKEDTTPLATYWQEQMQAWEASGQSQTAFCRTNDLNYHRFGYWRRKLSPTVEQQSSHRASNFVPVTVGSHSQTNDLSLTLPNGLVLSGITAGK